MDRQIIYPGAVPRSADILQMNKNGMSGIAQLAQAVLGTATSVAGLACTPTGVPSLQVNIASGSIYTYGAFDSTAYGSLGLDSTNLVKQGILAAQVSLSITPPVTTGFSQVYLVQVSYSDADSGNTVLPYYNAANPSVPFNGPNNSGTSQFTNRQGVCVVQLKAGIAAATGSQTTPAADSGYTGLYAITVANGQTQITSPNIATLATAPFFLTLPLIPTQAQNDARYPQIVKAPANLTFYVNSGTGNDSNTGLSAANPFATIQGAINKISLGYLCTGQVVVSIANGNYQGFTVNPSFVSSWSFVGNVANPNSVLVNATATGGRGLVAQGGVTVYCSGILWQSYYENISCNHSFVNAASCNYTAPTSVGNYPIGSYVCGSVFLSGVNGYSGNGPGIFLGATSGVITLGFTDVNGSIPFSMTITGTPAFSQGCAFASSLSNIFASSVATITGAATGQRYVVSANSVINSSGGGANYFPGNTVGVASNGGLYF